MAGKKWQFGGKGTGGIKWQGHEDELFGGKMEFPQEKNFVSDTITKSVISSEDPWTSPKIIKGFSLNFLTTVRVNVETIEELDK